MRRSALFILPFLSACMGGGFPVVLSDGSSRDDETGVSTPGGTDGGAVHSGFGILLNDTRGDNGALQVYEDSRLSTAAQGHADEMSRYGYMAHENRAGDTAGDRALAVGYDWNYMAENLARGYYSDTAVVRAWMNSASHRQNMLDSRAEDFGLGYANGYWVLMLGREFPTATPTEEVTTPAEETPAEETPATEAPVTENPVTETPVTDAGDSLASEGETPLIILPVEGESADPAE